MTPTQWTELGYRFWQRSGRTLSDGLWQKKLWQRDGHDRSDCVGYLNWYVYNYPPMGTSVDKHVGYEAHADLDDGSGPMGIRRMLWNPSETTPEIVKMVEDEYRKMAGVTP